jgi:predicted chitinase
MPGYSTETLGGIAAAASSGSAWQQNQETSPWNTGANKVGAGIQSVQEENTTNLMQSLKPGIAGAIQKALGHWAEIGGHSGTKQGKKQPPPPVLNAQYNPTVLATITQKILSIIPKEMAAYAKSSVPLILQQCAEMNVHNADQVAYILATTQHESRFGTPLYKRSESLVEDHNPYTDNHDGTFGAKVAKTGKHITANSEEELDTKYWDDSYGHMKGNTPGTTDGSQFRGRGFVQLTGRRNYHNQSAALNEQGFSYTVDGVTYGGHGNPPIDLEAHPDHVNRVPVLAARIMVSGMGSGSFGNRLDSHINDKKTDFVGARASVNNKDDAGLIAGYAKNYQSQLTDWPTVFVLDPAAHQHQP